MTGNQVTVVFGSDENYARPMTVAARSVLDTLDPAYRLRLCILDMGISVSTKALVTKSVASPRVELLWVDTLQERVRGLPTNWGFISSAGYARLFIPSVLPSDVSRALYLDCDVLVRRSVHELYLSDMHGLPALGCQDSQSPFVSSTYAVPLWYRAGLAAGDPNINSGVLLMDLDLWRAEDITSEALRYLTDGRYHFAQDQEAINAVLAGRCATVDPRWNQQSEIFQRPYQAIQAWSEETLDRVLTDPWIVHYSNTVKPWHYGDPHPRVDEWFEMLDRTAFSGWRPTWRRHVARRIRTSARHRARSFGGGLLRRLRLR